jgi:hypothetical protein
MPAFEGDLVGLGEIAPQQGAGLEGGFPGRLVDLQ